MRFRFLFVITALMPLALAGCRDSKIRTYRIPKESAAPSAAATAAAKTPTPAIHWEKPADWQEQTGNTMRAGSFLIAGAEGRQADMAITTFPGDVGGDFANVNRWRGQIQLAPIAESELAAAITSLDLPAGRFQLVDLVSDAPILEGQRKGRILGAWLKQPERTWFFKMTGDNDLIGTQRETFLAFLRTVEFAEPAAATPATATAPAADTNALPAESVPAAPIVPPPPPADVSLAWTAPASWTPKPLGQMRKGSFAVRGNDGVEADLSITSLSAATNPLLDNINRWRRQIALSPLTEADLPAQTTTLTSGDLQFTVIDYASDTTRVIGAILYRGSDAWFFKLTGPDAAVAQQKPAFLDFLKTVKTR